MGQQQASRCPSSTKAPASSPGSPTAAIPKPRSREVFTFHRPETMAEWLAKPTIASRAACTTSRRLIRPACATARSPPSRTWRIPSRRTGRAPSSRWPPARARPSPPSPRSTACSSTPTPSASCSSWTRKNLGEQAEQEFMAYVPNDDNRKFTELYNVQRLQVLVRRRQQPGLHQHHPAHVFDPEGRAAGRSGRGRQPGRAARAAEAAVAGRLQPEDSARVLRLHHHR